MKKNILLTLLSLVCMFAFVECKVPNTGKPGSSGKTLELMVVASNNVFSSSTKAVIDTIFSVPQDGLNRPEPRFEVVQIAPSSFENNTMFQAHRNILILQTDPNGLNKVYLERNKWSQPQVVVRVVATDRHALDSMLLANSERLLKDFYDMEYVRMKKIFSQTPNVKVNNMIREKYGFSLVFPEEFSHAKTEGNFMWVRKEAKDFGLHVYVSTAPATDAKAFEEAYILDNLDTLMKHHVPGPAEGSYQGTERRDFFYTRKVQLGDIEAVETRGLWRLYGDHMGGPFVCYTLPSPDGSNVITLVGLVYSPSERNKMASRRDLLMQVDGICRSITF